MAEHRRNTFNTDPDDQGFSLHAYRMEDEYGEPIPGSKADYEIRRHNVPLTLDFPITTQSRAEKEIRDRRQR
ncbi:hypothetical protein [Komagataeibacter medellinensis]|uniref:hypothetical protein n=1 Tax=Komagataeibacter medellinensis TaxID=1177712 RepID=UPI0011D1D087|nr:hypothetical protein [Komagataeibacter medellinensis]